MEQADLLRGQISQGDVEINKLTSSIIGAGMTVHTELGPGLLESVYQKALAIELNSRGLTVNTEVPVAVSYSGITLTEEGFRMDMLVNDSVVLELKSVECTKPLHKKQLLSYLRLSGKRIGLLINFNVENLKDGIERIVLGDIEGLS